MQASCSQVWVKYFWEEKFTESAKTGFFGLFDDVESKCHLHKDIFATHFLFWNTFEIKPSSSGSTAHFFE